MEIHRTARRHRVADEDIEHAGNLLELVFMEAEGEELVIHAMALWRSTSQELFGEDE